MSNIFSKISNFHVLILLVIIALLSLVASFVSHLNSGDINIASWLDGAFQNFGTEMFGAVVTFFLFEMILESRRHRAENLPIAIVLKSLNKEIELFQIRRFQLSRGEILNRIAAIPRKNEYDRHRMFSINHTVSIDFLVQIDRVRHNENEMKIIIPCTDEEIEQFDFRWLNMD